ncbi:MAG TPA: hypothetical protein VNG33_17000 [Polyangiaceae bacterium]|nr:hypothetical protein [Polyangiaceae bacterium]
MIGFSLLGSLSAPPAQARLAVSLSEAKSAQPVPATSLGMDPRPIGGVTPAAVGSDGLNWLLAYKTGANIVARIITSEGVPQLSVALGPSLVPWDQSVIVNVAFDGEAYVVVWSALSSTPPPAGFVATSYAQRVSSSGKLLGARLTIGTASSPFGRMTLTDGDSRVLLESCQEQGPCQLWVIAGDQVIRGDDVSYVGDVAYSDGIWLAMVGANQV